MTEDVFYVGVEQPVEVRKDLLLGVKRIITSLKRYEHFRMLREEKMKVIVQLKEIVSEISKANRKLRSTLPKAGLRSVETQRKEPVAKAPRKSTRSKLDILEDELSRIESRLRSLE